MIKRSKMKLYAGAMAGVCATALVGCEQGHTEAELDLAEQKAVAKALLEQNNQDNQELKEFIASAKEKDPSIVDAYYSVNDDGEKVINVVRDSGEKDSEGFSMLETAGLAVAGGLAGAALANALIPNNPPQNYYQTRSAYYAKESPEEERRRRGLAYYNYNQHSAAAVASSRSLSSSVGQKASPQLTTSKPAFQSKSGSSTRSSAYGSRGGFGG